MEIFVSFRFTFLFCFLFHFDEISLFFPKCFYDNTIHVWIRHSWLLSSWKIHKKISENRSSLHRFQENSWCFSFGFRCTWKFGVFVVISFQMKWSFRKRGVFECFISTSNHATSWTKMEFSISFAFLCLCFSCIFHQFPLNYVST